MGDRKYADPQLAELLPHIRRLLEPLASVVVGRLPYDVLAGLLKEALIAAAREKLRREDPAKRITKSALALKTGIDSRLIDLPANGEGSSPELSHPFADLLAMWKWEPEWQDNVTGAPLLLPIYGPGKSFQTLVSRSVGKNISYSEVMEVLLKSGNIERTDDRQLRLLDPFFKFSGLGLESGRLHFFGNLSGGLALCIQNRMASVESPIPNAALMMVRSIPESALPALAKDMGEMLVLHADKAGDQLDVYDDTETQERTYSAGVGNFFWVQRNE